MSRPVVAITCYVEQARWGVWDTSAALLPFGYVRHVERAGARAVILPPDPVVDESLLDALSGLVLAGGADLDPALYGQPSHPETAGLRPDRDTGELALLRAAEARGLPVLGICRGMQLLCVAHGGVLVQHLPDEVGHEGHRPAPGVYGRHVVRTVPGSTLAAVVGEQTEVASYHHQGVASAGDLVVSGHADDGTIEGVENDTSLGVLWHPEVGDDPAVFDWLVSTGC